MILSNVFTIVRLADYLRTNDLNLPTIRLILYTSETLYKNLRPLFKLAFPNAKVHLTMDARVDSDLIGVPATPPLYQDDDSSPVHQLVATFAVMELIAEDGTSIKSPTGKAISI